MRIQSIETTGIRKAFENHFDWLILSISYEERSIVILKALSDSNTRPIAFFNRNHSYNSEQTQGCLKLLSQGELIGINSDNPILTMDVMRETIATKIGSRCTRIGVDISCFTREGLAILMATLEHFLPNDCEVVCLYTEASEYTPDSSKGEEHCWLTHGIQSIRSILGYRGCVSLRAKTHLILLPGFETERALGIIESIQPDRLTLGEIGPQESIRPHFSVRMEKMSERISGLYRENVRASLKFSARNPFATRDAILTATDPTENTVVACLNTKISMMGACMAALDNKAIQLVYAQPLLYNTANFALPGSTIISFPFERRQSA